MPYKDPAARRAQRKRWAAANPEKVKRKNAAYREAHKAEISKYHAERYAAKADIIRAAQNEQNWRFRMWERARMSEATKRYFEPEIGLSIYTWEALLNPVFFVEIGDERRKEYLLEPLPRW